MATLHDIVEAAALVFRVTAAELEGPARWVPLTDYRSATMAACRRLTNGSFPAIARVFGGRDHTTVMTACRRAERLCPDLITAVVDAYGGRGTAPTEASIDALRAEVAALRAEVAALRAEVCAEPAGLRADLAALLCELRSTSAA